MVMIPIRTMLIRMKTTNEHTVLSPCILNITPAAAAQNAHGIPQSILAGLCRSKLRIVNCSKSIAYLAF